MNRAEFRIEDDPAEVDLDFASYHAVVTAAGGVPHYQRQYVARQVEIPADKAADFCEFENAILFDGKARRCRERYRR